MGQKDELLQRVLQNFEGNESERRRVADALLRADVSEEFGTLALAISETQAAGRPMTTAAQNYVYDKIYERFQSKYQNYVQDFDPSAPVSQVRGGPLSYNEYFSRDRSAYYDVLGEKIDLSMGRTAHVPGMGTTAGRLLPQAFQADTVSGAMRWLALSETPSVWQNVTHAYRNKFGGVAFRAADEKLVNEEFNAGWLAGFENMHTYQPGSGTNFAVHFSDQVSKGVRRFRDQERAFRTGATAFSAFDSDEDGETTDFGGYSISGESGEWLDLGQNSALDTASSVADAGAFTMTPLDPGYNVSETLAELQAAHPKDINDWTNFNVQTGVYGTKGRSANTFRMFGIDPNSPAAQAGMENGDFIGSMGRLLRSGEINDLVDGLANGQEFYLSVSRMRNGELQEIPLSIFPGPQSGRSIEGHRQPNWIENLAGMLDPEYGSTAQTSRGTWRKDATGRTFYQSLPPTVSQTGARNTIPSFLYTTKPEYTAGMYENRSGEWMLAPLSTQPGDTYSYPVQLSAGSIKTFGQLYDQQREVWDYYQKTWDNAGVLADLTANAEGNGAAPGSPEYEAIYQQEFGKRLPLDIPRPGTALYNQWKSSNVMLGELRSLERSVTGAAPAEPYERTIEEWDTLASSMERFTNPSVYQRVIDPRQLKRARAVVSSAGNLFNPDLQEHASALMERLSGASQRKNRTEFVALAYSSISDNDFLSAFAPGDAGVEDDWGWEIAGSKGRMANYPGMPQPRGKLRPVRDRRRIEDSTQTMMLGGDPGSREYLDGLPNEAEVEGPVVQSAEVVNLTNRYPDPLITARTGLTPEDPLDAELEDASESALEGGTERRFQKALSLIVDPANPRAALSSRIAAEGIQKGYYHTDWDTFFEGVNASADIHRNTYRALFPIHGANTEAARAAELTANLSSLTRLGRKDLFMKTRLGEGPKRPKDRVFRETLRQISEAYELGLNLADGDEAELYDQISALGRSNPEALQAVNAAFAERGDQLNVSRQYVGQLGRVSGQPFNGTPTPARSHFNRAPGGGRSQAKWSDEDQYRMRRGRGSTDPVTGEFDPFALENTPVSAHLAGVSGNGNYGGAGGPPEEPPDIAGYPDGEEPETPPPAGAGTATPPPGRMADLNSGQQLIFYDRMVNKSRVSRQVGGFLKHEYNQGENPRNFFNFITRDNPSEGFLSRLHSEAEEAFAVEGLSYGALEQIEDETLPPGYSKYGGSVSGGNFGEPASATGSGGANANGSAKRRKITRLPDGDPGRDPANWPAVPEKGMTLSFQRNKLQQSAYAVEDGSGSYQWVLDTKDGIMPLTDNPGYGSITNEAGDLTHQVFFNERRQYDFQQKLRTQGVQTPPPARSINREAGDWPAAPEEGWTLEYKNGSTPLFLHATQSDDGSYYWAQRVEDELIRRDDPGYGQITDKDGKAIHNVDRIKYERARAAKAHPTPLSATPPVSSSPQAAPTPVPQARAGRSSVAFQRFNNSLREAGAQFAAQMNESEGPRRYGLNASDDEGFRRGVMNEFYNNAAMVWNTMAETPPDTLDEVTHQLSENFGVEPEVVEEAAQTFWAEATDAKRWHREISKERPFITPKRTLGRDASISPASGQGAVGWRSLAASRVSEIGDDAIRDFTSPSLGASWVGQYEDRNGVSRGMWSVWKDERDEQGRVHAQETVSPDVLHKGNLWAQNAYNAAVSGELPSSPEAIFATVKDRMYQSISKQMKEEIESATNRGSSTMDANVHGNIVREVADHFAKKVQEELKTSLGETVGDVSSVAYEGSRYDAKVKNLDDARSLYERSARVRKDLGDRSIEAALTAPDETIVFDENDRSYSLGGVSSAGNASGYPARGSGGRGGVWGPGGMGGLLYGTYILGREWKMMMGEQMADAQRYGQYASQFGTVALGAGADAGMTDAGYMARQEIGQNYQGHAAYQSLGGFSDVSYLASSFGNAPGRLATNAGLAMGMAAGGQILAGMAGFVPGLAGAASVLGPAGMAIGGTILAGSVAMEAYNAVAQPEEPVTWGGLFRSGEQSWLRSMGTEKVKDRDFGATYDQRTAGYKGLSDLEWANAKIRAQYTDKQIAQVLPYQQADILLYQGETKEIEEMRQNSEMIQADTGESSADLLAGMKAQKRMTGKIDYGLAAISSANALAGGMVSSQYIGEAGQYASSLGYLEGSPDFTSAMEDYIRDDNMTSRAKKRYSASRWAGWGSQWQASMGTGEEFAGMGTQFSQIHGIDTQAEASAVTRLANGLQADGRSLGLADQRRIGFTVARAGAIASGAIGTAVGLGMQSGLSQEQSLDFMDALSFTEMTPLSAGLYEKALGGDLMGAMSFDAWQGGGNPGNRWNDQAGRSIIQNNGAAALGVYNRWAGQFGLPSGLSAGQFLGTNNPEIINAFNQDGNRGGFFGLQMLASEKSYAASMASVGVQMRGIAQTENFNWGADQGGSWSNPTAGSSWGIQNQQIALQDASTRAGSADQWQRMTVSNDFAIQRENNQAQRMTASQNYQQYQFSQQYNQFQQQQSWAQEDWQYQDTSRQMQFGWQMEDLNEAIRFSSGRERKQLIKQRDRLSTTENLEEDQIDTQRERQKQLWAQQEESYQKQKQYMAENARLDLESFQTNKSQRESFLKMDADSYNRRVKEYEAEKKLSDELRELQRKHEYDQLQLQKEAAGAQAAAAAAQREINKAMIEGQQKWEEITGNFQQMNTYNTAWRLMAATTEMLKTADTTSTYKMQKIVDLLKILSSTETSTKWGGERE